MNLLDLVVKISCDDQATSGIEGVKSTLSGIGRVGAVAAAGVAAVTGAVAAVGTASLNAYASYEQLVGGVDTLFKDASGQLQAYAAQAYQTAGMSANQYMETTTSFAASLIQGLGGDTQAAVEVANMAITDMSDNANKMGTDIGMIRDAYQGFAKDNYDMLDNLKLGYGGTQAEMARLINDTGVMGDTFKATAKNVNEVPFDKMIEAIHQVQTEMGITGTTALEASTTIEGSMNQAKAAWENFLTGLGDENADLSGLTTQLLGSLGNVASNVTPRIAIIAQGIVDALPQMFEGLSTTLGPVLSEALAAAWNTAVTVLGQMGIQLPNIDAGQIQQAFQTIIDTVTMVRDTVGPIFSEIGNAMINAFSNIDIAGIFGRIQEVASALAPVMSEIGNAIVAYVVPGFQNLARAVGPFIEAIGNLIITLAPVIQVLGVGLAQAIGIAATGFSQIVGAITTVINGFVSFISFVGSIPGQIASFLGSIISSVASWAGEMFSNAQNAGQRFFSALQSKFGEVVSFVTGIPNRILSALGNLGNLLFSAGKSVIQGLINGIKSMIGSITSTVSGVVQKIRNFFPFSPAKEGPFSGHGYTTWSGRALMRDFGDSIVKNGAYAINAMNSVMDSIERASTGDVSFGTIGSSRIRSSAAGGTVNNYYIGDTQVTTMDDQRFAESFIRLMTDSGRLART